MSFADIAYILCCVRAADAPVDNFQVSLVKVKWALGRYLFLYTVCNFSLN